MSHRLSQTGQMCTCGMLWCFDGSFRTVETQDEQENSAMTMRDSDLGVGRESSLQPDQF